MKLALLLTAVLLAAPCRAQLSLPDGGLQGVRDGAKALAQSRAAATAAAPVDKRALDGLIDRLAKDGTMVQQPGGILHAFQKTEANSTSERQVTVGLLEIAGKKNEGVIAETDMGVSIIDLVERHTYSRLEAQTMVVTVAAHGTAKVENRVYMVTMDGRLLGAISQSGSAKADKTGAVVIDESKLKTTTLSPAAVKKDWDALLPELVKMGKVIEA